MSSASGALTVQAVERGGRGEVTGSVVEELARERTGFGAVLDSPAAMPVGACTTLSKPRRSAHGPL